MIFISSVECILMQINVLKQLRISINKKELLLKINALYAKNFQMVNIVLQLIWTTAERLFAKESLE